MRLAREQIEAMPAMTYANEYIKGIGKGLERLLILLDLSKLLSLDEIAAIWAV